MPERTPQTNPLPSGSTAPAAGTPATPGERLDPVTGATDTTTPAAGPLTRESPAPLAPPTAELPPYLLPLSGAGVVLGGLALLTGLAVYLQLRRSHGELSRQVKELRTKLAALDLNLETLDSGNQELSPLPSWPGPAAAAPAPLPPTLEPPFAPPSASDPTALPLHKDWSGASVGRLADPFADPVAAPEPAPVLSKATLIQAVNNGDRQLLREHTTAQLNITSDSEHALAIGRSQPTQLEAVPGGGSYWLAVIGDQAWLFPTELTLRGFLSVQPNKGLYSYEKQIISRPQLIEPALLRQDGDRWTVESLGRVAIP